MNRARTLFSLREAATSDAFVLAELWSTQLRRVDHEDQVADLRGVIRSAAADPDQRLVVADYDGELAGAVHLAVAPVTVLNPEQTVQALAPTVFPRFRRHGIGRMLMESAVAFAEETGVALVTSAAAAGSRDANRFMARLGLGPQATVRIAPTLAVRARLTAQRPTLATTPSGSRQVTRVLAARRSMRRAQSAG